MFSVCPFMYHTVSRTSFLHNFRIKINNSPRRALAASCVLFQQSRAQSRLLYLLNTKKKGMVTDFLHIRNI